MPAFKDLKDMVDRKKEEPIKRVTIDVLKPHKPDIVAFGRAICAEKSVKGLSISVYAVDVKTESLKITLEGSGINFDKVRDILNGLGAVMHSIDSVVVGKKEKVT